ncbi:MAG: tetratricopeptide repeat protein [Phycisphaerae bacterium]|nr:tetratricopeptide repeat protein [Phycisphaerae bacterium]
MLDRSQSSSNSDAEALAYQQGIAALEAGHYLHAVESLRRAAGSTHLCATLARFYLGQAHMMLGIEQLRSGRHAEAIEQLTAARQLNPGSETLSKYLAASYAAQRKFDLAAAEIERDNVVGCPDPERPIRLAHAFARDGRFEQAVETLVKAIDDAPHRLDVRIQLGLLYGAAERYEDAVCVLMEAVELAPLDADARTRLGLSLAAAGDLSESVEQLAIAQKLRPQDASIALMLVMAVEAAQTTCIKLAMDPIQGRLGVVDDRSLDTLGELVAKDPELVESFFGLPFSEADRELFPMLAAVLERAIERQPGYADLYLHCSRVYERLGMTREALARADQAVEINPKYVQALIHLARLRATADQTDEAMNRLDEAVQFGGDYPDVHLLMGQLYQKKGATSEARRQFSRALELNSGYDAARHALAALKSA